MKFIIFAVFLVVAGAYAQHPDMHAEVVRSEAVVNQDNFNYAYETSNGIVGSAAGELKQFGKDESGVVSHGEFGWTSPEGEHIQMSYTADENGYHPTGTHLPVAHPIPEAIARALDWIAAHGNSLKQ